VAERGQRFLKALRHRNHSGLHALGPGDLAFPLRPLDRQLAASKIHLIVRSSEGGLRKARNLCCRPDVSLVKLYDVNSAPNNSGVVTTQTAHRDAMLAEPNAAGEKTTADFVECWAPANPLTSRAPASILGACAGRERSEG